VARVSPVAVGAVVAALDTDECVGLHGRHRVNMVLKQDVAKLGFRGEEVTVKAGYARNYLYPEKLAVYATEANLQKFKVDKESNISDMLEKQHGIVVGVARIDLPLPLKVRRRDG
jgi:ribosomal protein L9